MSHRFRLVVALLGAAVLAGCGSTSAGRGKPNAQGFFGEDFAKLEKTSGKGQWQLFYENPNRDLSDFDKMMLDPVTIWVDDETDSDTREISAPDRQRITNNFYTMLRKSISQYYTIVDEPTPGAARLRVALTDAQASNRSLDTVSSVLPQMRVATSLQGYATGKPAFVGEAAMAFRISDSMTGETITMGADKRVGTKSLSGSTDSWSDVDNALQYWADLAAYRACTKRGRSDCEAP